MGEKNAKTIVMGEGTILEQFKTFFKENKSIEDIMAFLEIKSTELYDVDDYTSIPEDVQDELIEFYEYFMEEFNNPTLFDRLEYFGEDDALVLQLGEYFIEERITKEQEEYINSCPDIVVSEAEKLVDTIFDINKNLSISIVSDLVVNIFEKDAEVPVKVIEFQKRDFLFYCCQMIEDQGIMIVAINEADNSTKYFSINTFSNKIWYPVSAMDTEKYLTTTKSGEVIKRGENVRYVEIERERV